MSARPGPGLLSRELTPEQAAVVDAPVGEPQSLFLEGPAGSGKTTAAVGRLLRLLEAGVPAESILVLVPQRRVGRPYLDALLGPGAPAGARVDVLTIGGLAQRCVELYWPLVAAPAGFARPDRPPIFLTLETAQYYMDRLVDPYIQQGAFGEVTLSRHRLISQIIDDLNKAAAASFPHEEIGARLSAAWKGESSRLRVYERVQACASDFRRYCLEHNLLDFSLQIEVFVRYVLALPEAAAALRRRYRHILADNVEEDVPVAHDLLADWLPSCDSAWIIYDEQGGLRTYLGADPVSAYGLRSRCRARVRFTASLVSAPAILALASGIGRSLGLEGAPAAARPAPANPAPEQAGTDPREAAVLIHETFHTGMVRTVAAYIADLVHGEGLPPEQIAVLAPFMGDALRFDLMLALERKGVPCYSHRPSRPLRDEPAVRCLLTLAKLAHPGWGLVPPRSDVVHALVAAIADMDLVRACHLAAIAYRPAVGGIGLVGFERIRPKEQLKITYLLGNRYDALRRWLAAYAEGAAAPLDLFFTRLFDEVLSRPGYGFRRDRDAAAAAAHLIASARRFRQTIGEEWPEAAAAYVDMVEQGVLAAQYLPPVGVEPRAVLLSPAYTFAMGNRTVEVQFWLNVSSSAWGRRLYQPLTHPYVLTRQWPQGTPWTDADEDLTNRRALYRLVVALLRRCRRCVYLADSTYSERGFEEHGLLQQVVFRTLRRAAREAETGSSAGEQDDV
ncbi:MAG: hypothetical protein K6V36_06425 [Anaerolineae bacterium]|nr:hypothetical protein [Anaerolineae bacterium]